MALSNLRALVILIVLAFHAALAYLDFLPAEPFPFNQPPYEWQAFPIIDSRRFMPFDLFCAWQDVCLMSLMYFMSGLFVWPSLLRKGSLHFLGDRLLRIGVPLAATVALLMPIAYYPAYLTTAVDRSPGAYWRALTELPFWPCGPQWFLWQLLALNVLAAGLFKVWPSFGETLARLVSTARGHPVRFFVGLACASALAYVPLMLLFTPWQWAHFGPVGFQLSRPLHYTVYFFAGLAVGAFGLERGLLACDGMLARRWAAWLAAALLGFALWMAPTALTVQNEDAPLLVQVAAGLGFALACASGCLFATGLFVRFARNRSRIVDSLSESAYGMYLVHYLFVVWLQYVFLGAALLAVVKAGIVLAGALLLSWAAALALCHVPAGARLIGTKR
ncbi:MAG: acyltransferase [Hyphomicrobiales bacterium]|nr:acyltransferase [Hyphomicrobiales bacterium]